MNQILLVEDDQDSQLIIKKVLENRSENQVHAYATLTDAEKKLSEASVDLIILDVMLPDGDGFQFLAKLKNDQRWHNIPVLMVTGRSTVEDQVMGFTLGAEDYIVKPIQPAVMQARVNSKLKNLRSQSETRETLELGDLIFNLPKQKLEQYFADGPKEIELTGLEFKILLHFAKNPERVYSRDQLLDSIWGNKVNILDRTIDTHISHIRKKIRPSQYTIESVHGVGYRLIQNDIKDQAA